MYISLGDAEVIAATERAVLVELDGEERWFPRAVLRDGDAADKGDVIEVELEAWFASKEGLA